MDVVRFERRRDAAPVGRALFVWCDDVEVLPGRAPLLRRHADEGFRIVALSWRPEVGEGAVSPEQVDAEHERIRCELGVPIEFLHCPHPAGPPVCWCRKPLPGLPVAAIVRHRIDVERSFYVGRSSGDVLLARRLGLPYRDAAEFFAS